MTKYSILDLIRIPEGGDAKDALDNAKALAAAAEEWGYARYWISEHHNMPGIASAATAVVLAHIASGSTRIRIGAGGVMLPNHAPLIIAEQFGTLARLYPNRVDLGVGRADGSVDSVTRTALRRNLTVSRFPQDILELQQYFAAEQPNQKIQAVPAAGTDVPIWILGTSTYGAQLAAEMGLPYAFGGHLMPDELLPAIEVYRRNFKRSKYLSKPYVMVGLNIVVADTEKEARRLATTRHMSIIDLFRGRLGPSRPPIDDIDAYRTPREGEAASHAGIFAVGSTGNIKEYLTGLVEQTKADELIFVSDIFSHQARMRSYELLAQCMTELQAPVPQLVDSAG